MMSNAVLGFRSLNVIVDSMIILVAVVLAFFLVSAIVAARRVAKVPTIRLVSTKQPPEMSIGTGLTWHLFLSHIWCVAQLGRMIKPGRIQLQPQTCRSTGQDAVGNIKSELQLLMPGLKIFLDARRCSAPLRSYHTAPLTHRGVPS